MSRSKFAIAVLALLLIGSNGWWAYHALDVGVTQAYQGDSLNANKKALAQMIALLPLVARPNITRAEIIAAARIPGSHPEPFEKDGFVWVEMIGMRFNEKGQLIEVTRAWSPP